MKKINTLFKKDLNDLSKVTTEIDPLNQWVIDGDGVPTRKFDGTATAIINQLLYKRFDAKLKTGKELKQLDYYIQFLSIGCNVTKVSGKKWSNNEFIDKLVGFDIHPVTKMKSAILQNSVVMDLRQLKPIGIEFPLEYYKQIPPDAIPCQEPDNITGHWPHWVLCERNNPEDKYHWEAFDKLENVEDDTYELCGPKINGNKEKLTEHILIKHGSIKCEIDNYSYDSIKSYLEQHDIEGIVFHHKTDDRMCKIRKVDFGIVR